jgi:hypothetical protein
LERGAEEALFGGGEQEYDVADFPLSQLELPAATLAALEGAGYNTFLDIIDLDRGDLIRIPGIGSDEADAVLRVIDALTVEESAAEEAPASGPTAEELAEAREVAAEILGISLPEKAGGDEEEQGGS